MERASLATASVNVRMDEAAPAPYELMVQSKIASGSNKGYGAFGNKCKVIFEGEDFATPGAVDSDDAIRGLMGFLTLKPGDTDKDYFKNYTPTQRRFADQYAEDLQMEVINRFGED
jgi:hypothetical protein